MNPHRRTALAAALALSACAGHLIPGTEIQDTSDNRAVFEVIREYGAAMQRKDAPAVLALVSNDYFDDAGTPDPADDLDRAKLEKALPADLARVPAMRLELTVKSLDVQKDEATADVFYDASYDVQTPAAVVPKRQSDVHRMAFRKESGQWKIVSGL